MGPRVLVVGCGALARELRDLCHHHGLEGEVAIECLPASLHNRPEKIAPAVRQRLELAVGRYDHILVGYADCGTGGHLDAVCEEFGVTRLPGAHCYEFYAGAERFASINDPDPTAFYLTDYLAKNFDRLVYHGLGIASHPELADQYFANYTRVVLLAQVPDPDIEAAAVTAAARLGLPLHIENCGYGQLQETLVEVASR